MQSSTTVACELEQVSATCTPKRDITNHPANPLVFYIVTSLRDLEFPLVYLLLYTVSSNID